LNEIFFRKAKAALVADIVDVIGCLGVLTVYATNLYVVLVSDCFEKAWFLTEVGQVDVNGGAQSCSKVCRAAGNVAEIFGMGKLSDFFNYGTSTAESREHCSNVGSCLHRYYAELVLFVDPNKECLSVIVEDSTALWPVAVESACLKETVSLFE
jgi:hypothetical protein